MPTDIQQTLSDNAANLVDANLSSLVVGYELQIINEYLTDWADSVISTETRSLNFSDDINNLADNFTKSVIVFLTASTSDNINNLADTAFGFTIDYQIQIINEYMTDWADSGSARLIVNLTQSLSDNFSLSDLFITTTLEYRLTVANQYIDWADTIGEIVSVALQLSDNINNFADAVSTFRVGILTDSESDVFTITDGGFTVSSQYAISIVNQWMDMSDAAAASAVTATDFTESVSDSLNNWSDSIQLILGYYATQSDDLNAWQDNITKILEYLLSNSDSFSLTDDATNELRSPTEFTDSINNFSDQIVLLLAGYMQLSDDANSLADTITLSGVSSSSRNGDFFFAVM